MLKAQIKHIVAQYEYLSITQRGLICFALFVVFFISFSDLLFFNPMQQYREKIVQVSVLEDRIQKEMLDKSTFEKNDSKQKINSLMQEYNLLKIELAEIRKQTDLHLIPPSKQIELLISDLRPYVQILQIKNNIQKNQGNQNSKETHIYIHLLANNFSLLSQAMQKIESHAGMEKIKIISAPLGLEGHFELQLRAIKPQGETQ